jgi:signal transduction histidine kinase
MFSTKEESGIGWICHFSFVTKFILMTPATQVPQPLTKVLLVDDRVENLLALESLLADLPSQRVQICKAQSGREALELLLKDDFALALLDVQMPEINGFELAELMRGSEKTMAIPIIFVTAGAIDTKHTFMGYEAGAVDFLYKPLDPRIVRSKVRVFLELEEKRLIIKAQMEELTKALRARDEFLSMVSHELKTPLTSLRLQLQMTLRRLTIKEGAPVDLEKLLKTFTSADRQVVNLNRLIEELIDVSRIRTGHMTIHPFALDLSLVAKEVVERMSEQLKLANCPVGLDLEEPLMTSCDSLRIEQVITNLLSNAARYASNGPITVKTWSDKNWAYLSVKDSGSGIRPEKQKTIFDRFERDSNDPGIDGLGLGLYIVKQIVKAHRGEIELISPPGQGATFIFKLPLKSQ